MRTTITLLLVLVSLILTGQDTAKKKWFVGINGGYGFASQKNVIGESIQGDANTPDANSYTKNYITSLGKGLYGNIYIGRQLTNNSFIEVGVRYFRSQKVNLTTYIYENVGTPSHYNATFSSAANNFSLSIQYGFLFPINQSFSWNAKTGLVISKNLIHSDYSFYNYDFLPAAGFEHKYSYKYSTPISLGWTGSLSLQYQCLQRLRLTTDFFFQLQSAKVQSREAETYTVDGQDKINTLSAKERRVEYYDGNSSEQYKDKSNPLIIPMSSIGITIGMCYLF